MYLGWHLVRTTDLTLNPRDEMGIEPRDVGTMRDSAPVHRACCAARMLGKMEFGRRTRRFTTMTAAMFPGLRAAVSRWRKLALSLVCLIAGTMVALPLSATVYRGEIVPTSVSATVSSTFDPVNGVSVTFRWTTLEPGNSIVVIENDLDYQSDNNSASRQIVQNDYTTKHVVVVDHFPAYGKYATWGYYVASFVGDARQWATFPGPGDHALCLAAATGCGGDYASFNLLYWAHASQRASSFQPVASGRPERLPRRSQPVARLHSHLEKFARV